MKTRISETWLYGLLGVAGLALAFSGIALAQVTPQVVEETPAPMVVDIASDGSALIRGTVTEVSEGTIMVESWGGAWTVRVNDDGSVIPLPNEDSWSTDLGAIAVGDFIGAEGMIAGDAAATIDASFVRNWTTAPLPGVFEDTTAIDVNADISTGNETDTVNTTGDLNTGTDTDAANTGIDAGMLQNNTTNTDNIP